MQGEESTSIYSCLVIRMGGKNHKIKVADKSFENVEFKYLRTLVTNQK